MAAPSHGFEITGRTRRSGRSYQLPIDGATVLATPDELKGASVTAKIIGQVKGPKINGYTFKRRTNNHRRYGHRQKYHLVEITSITV